MSENPAAIVQRASNAWARRDEIATLALKSPDVVCANYMPQGTLPFGGGPAVGKAFVFDRLHLIIDQLDRLKYESVLNGVDGNVVRVDDCHDTERMRAFMRLISSTAVAE